MPRKSREKRLAYNRKYNKIYWARPEVKQKWKEYLQEYFKRPEVKEKQKEYRNRPEVKRRKYEQRQNNPAYKKRQQLRDKVRLAVVKKTRYTSTIHELIGCNVSTARNFLQSQFQPWMNWENYGRGKGKWCIDHIIPVASIDIFNKEQVKRIFHYTNMQPLGFLKNCEKGNN